MRNPGICSGRDSGVGVFLISPLLRTILERLDYVSFPNQVKYQYWLRDFPQSLSLLVWELYRVSGGFLFTCWGEVAGGWLNERRGGFLRRFEFCSVSLRNCEAFINFLMVLGQKDEVRKSYELWQQCSEFWITGGFIECLGWIQLGVFAMLSLKSGFLNVPVSCQYPWTQGPWDEQKWL